MRRLVVTTTTPLIARISFVCACFACGVWLASTYVGDSTPPQLQPESMNQPKQSEARKTRRTLAAAPPPNSPKTKPVGLQAEEASQLQARMQDELQEEIERCDERVAMLETDCSTSPCVAVMRSHATQDLSVMWTFSECSSFQVVAAKTFDCGNGEDDRLLIAVEEGLSMDPSTLATRFSRHACR